MDISRIPTGSNPPAEVNAVIEIPQGGVPVKYELDKESGAVFVDRFLHTAMFYPRVATKSKNPFLPPGPQGH
jgi:inorganic pyrophosphatase